MSESIGQRIKRLRLAANLSQRDCASPGVSYAYISRIEAGARSPSVKALRKLAVRLGVTVEYLETGVSETLTDQLLSEARRWTNGRPIRATIVPRLLDWEPREGEPVGVFLRYQRVGLGERTVRAGSLTEALLELRAREQEVDRLLAERDRIDRSLLESR